MATTRHMSLVERGGRTFLRPQAVATDKGLAHNKRNVRKPDISNPKKKDFEHIKLPAKLLDYFLRSNKSNVNQSDFCAATYLILYTVLPVVACACYHIHHEEKESMAGKGAVARLTVDEKACIERGAQLDGGEAVGERRSKVIRGRRKPFYAVNSNASESENNSFLNHRRQQASRQENGARGRHVVEPYLLSPDGHAVQDSGLPMLVNPAESWGMAGPGERVVVKRRTKRRQTSMYEATARVCFGSASPCVSVDGSEEGPRDSRNLDACLEGVFCLEQFSCCLVGDGTTLE